MDVDDRTTHRSSLNSKDVEWTKLSSEASTRTQHNVTEFNNLTTQVRPAVRRCKQTQFKYVPKESATQIQQLFNYIKNSSRL